MKDMSPSVEKKDASPHVGCVPEGILSDVKNNVPDARGNDFLLAGEKKDASSLSMFRRSEMKWMCAIRVSGINIDITWLH
ncbi:unnamed protein product [Urochloa humidicola]